MAVLPKWLRGLKTPSIMLNGNSVTFIHQHKYLGIILNEDMYDGPDMMQQVTATYFRGNVLISRFMKM